MNLMLDLETLSIKPNAMVFEIAMVCFDESGPTSERFCREFNPSTGEMDLDTVVFWIKHNDVCSLVKNSIPESQAVEEAFSFLESKKDHLLWSQPQAFDCVVLEQLLSRHGLGMPITFGNWRDLSTVRELAGWPTPGTEQKNKHKAYFDCLRQIDMLVACWEELK